MPLKHRLRDFLLYIVIGIGVVTGALLLAVFAPNISRTWFMFIGATVFLCMFISKMYWQYRRSAKLWALLILFLVVHIVVYTITFASLRQFPTILFLFAVPIEIMVVAAVVKLCLNLMPGRVKL
jgi:hypothetical protein